MAFFFFFILQTFTFLKPDRRSYKCSQYFKVKQVLKIGGSRAFTGVFDLTTSLNELQKLTVNIHAKDGEVYGLLSFLQ